MRSYPDAVSIFLLPPSHAAMEARLRGRGTERPDAIDGRLAEAMREIESVSHYEYVIVNDELEACVDRLRSIVLAERARLQRTREDAERIVTTFRKDTFSD